MEQDGAPESVVVGELPEVEVVLVTVWGAVCPVDGRVGICARVSHK